MRLEFEQRRNDAGNDALAIARLAVWCEKQDLQAEAATSAAAAIELAPDDAGVRELLGYVPRAGKMDQEPLCLESERRPRNGDAPVHRAVGHFHHHV